MTDRELARRTRQVLEERGWQPAPGIRRGVGPICLAQAAIIADNPDGPYQLSKALGFRSIVQIGDWNDIQTSVAPIFARLDEVINR